ncbi:MULTISPECIES: formyltetrahydrofolate deformylase [unclassified Mycolicibacterium]|uniref:formyltetrahydrofolate deformylase n=1 Tax=unclassified Mycolicibacterium TaxID=2636767 RepID=UPI002EDBABAD
MNTFTLTLTCPQRPGIVHAITRFLFQHKGDILEHQQFDDAGRGQLYLRTAFQVDSECTEDQLIDEFAATADEFGMSFTIRGDRVPRVLVMVSKQGHCLNDLVFRWRSGTLDGELAAVVSNHDDLRSMAEAAGLPFYRIPVTAENKPQAEAQMLKLVDDLDIDLVVLARYMQVLSDEACTALYGRAINIHRSFLPGFKGARPYQQAFQRGVKLVGATAHYVTPELDEGPIIEQEVIRIDHAYDERALATVGRDAEALALARAVRWHCQSRVLLNGHSTVVFR